MRSVGGRGRHSSALDRIATSAVAARTLADMVRPATVVPATCRCDEARAAFGHNGTTSLVVTQGSAVGVLGRTAFEQAMSGGGYNRALSREATIAGLTDWAPVLLDVDTDVATAASTVLARGPAATRADDVPVRVLGGYGLVETASLLHVMAAQLAQRTTSDPLTGLVGRSTFLQMLEAACADRSGTVAVVVIDLDRFGSVNDKHGAPGGDRLLVAVADSLREIARPDDIVARLDGDEFALLLRLPGAALAGARGLAERVRSAVSRCAPDGTTCTASIGLAVAGPSGAEAPLLLKESQLSVREAKRAGGNRVVIAGWVPAAIAEDRGRRGNALVSAVLGQELRLNYQPIVTASSGELVAVEALLRWQHPSDGLLGPHHFLPGADARTARAVDRWVLQRACLDLTSWSGHPDPSVAGRAPERINVNLTPASLVDSGLVDAVLEALTLSRLEPRRLHLELPETADLDALSAARTTLDELAKLGVGLALDDVGAGTTASWRIGRIDVDVEELKVDRSLVAGLPDGRVERAVVRMLVGLAEEVGALLTAEGVETLEQLESLRSLGVGAAQGFYIARPLTLGQLQAWAARPPRLPDVPALLTSR